MQSSKYWLVTSLVTPTIPAITYTAHWHDGLVPQSCAWATTLTSGVDDTVRRVSTSYEIRGMVEAITSWDDATVGSGNVVTEVQFVYNDIGQVTHDYQAYAGAANTSTIPALQYGDADGSANTIRPTSVTYPNGRVITYGYGSVDGMNDALSLIDAILAYGASTKLDRYAYTYDRAGNRTAKTNRLNHDFDEVYEYDAIDRLISSARADDFAQSWTLDALGNFVEFDDDGQSQTRTHNPVNEITGITGGWITPTYDAAGNMISGPRPGDETTRVHYVYDAWNRLVIVKADDSGDPGDMFAEYQYDGTNRRIQKVITEAGGGPSEAHYFYNGSWQLLEERFVDGQGATVASNRYVWSPRYIDALIVRFHDANGDGDYLDAGDNVRYYTADANFNITATIDAGTGDVIERYVYTAYGTATAYSATWTDPVGPAIDGPLYCGCFFDAETALCHVRNRYYDSSLSAFISRDPVMADLNFYRYVLGNPTSGTDPKGLDFQTRSGLRYRAPPCPAPASTAGPSGVFNVDGTLRVSAFCQRIKSSSSCPTQCKAHCEKMVQQILDVALGHSVSNVTENCGAWVDEFPYGKLTEVKPGCFTFANKLFEYPQHWIWKIYDLCPSSWGLANTTIRHRAILVTACSGDRFFLDNGWWGGAAHVFSDEQINCSSAVPK